MGFWTDIFGTDEELPKWVDPRIFYRDNKYRFNRANELLGQARGFEDKSVENKEKLQESRAQPIVKYLLEKDPTIIPHDTAISMSRFNSMMGEIPTWSEIYDDHVGAIDGLWPPTDKKRCDTYQAKIKEYFTYRLILKFRERVSEAFLKAYKTLETFLDEKGYLTKNPDQLQPSEIREIEEKCRTITPNVRSQFPPTNGSYLYSTYIILQEFDKKRNNWTNEDPTFEEAEKMLIDSYNDGSGLIWEKFI